MIRQTRGKKSTYLVVLTPILKEPRTREWLIKNLPIKNEKTIDANLHYLRKWDIIKKSGNEFALINYVEPNKQLEIMIEKAIKQTLWEMPLEKSLIKSGVYFEGQLFYVEDIVEVMKKYPDIFAFEFKTINEAFGKNLTNDENFISNVAMKVGIPPDEPIFKRMLWRCFSKIKIAKIIKKL